MASVSDNLSPELIARYRHPVPRYTSYPSADRFSEDFGQQDFVASLKRSAKENATVAWYVHLPFCSHMCAYCGCNVAVSNNPQTKANYLRRLLLEIDRVAEHLGEQASSGVHFGGGTPNSYSTDAISQVVEALELITPFQEDAERSIEIDPRVASTDDIAQLRLIGFNRISMGVQDFAEPVQRAIGRLQSYERTAACVEAARRAAYDSVNLDLIYGLPHQTLETFRHTVDKVLTLSPDRIALFGYAHIPHLRKNQLRIQSDALPNAESRVAIYEMVREALCANGYEAIGLDHFAKPDDPLAVAQKAQRLYRSFQGYTTVGGLDLIGVGMSSISLVGGSFSQNEKRLHNYSEAIDGGGFATERGYRLTDDDQVRAFAIEQLMCNMRLSWAEVRERFGVGPAELPDAMGVLEALSADGLVDLQQDQIEVTAIGQRLVRHVAAAFDERLNKAPTEAGARYSSAV